LAAHTLVVDFEHVFAYKAVLAQALQAEYYR
jgi:hypothetical protein